MANIYEEHNFLTMSRSKFDVKFSHKTSVPFGKMVPIGQVLDVTPGSTIKLDLNNVTRMLTPVAPIMDDISMDVYGWFVPWRLLFNKTKQFFGENDQVAWTLNQSYQLPHIVLQCEDLDGVYTDDADKFYNTNSDDEYYLYLVDDASTPTKVIDSVFTGSLFDYMGLPFVYPNMQLLSEINLYASRYNDLISIQAMPFRGIQLIYNEKFRNENVTDPILDLLYDENDYNINLNDFVTLYRTKADSGNLSYRFWFLPSVARWKDLFTSALPAPQRGPAVGLPLYGSANVVGAPTLHDMGQYTGIQMKPAGGFASGTQVLGVAGSSAGTDAGKVGATSTTGSFVSDANLMRYSNLIVDLQSTTSATVNQIRYAFATQRYYEKLARSGARYHEYLKVMFGVRPSDATLQLPQFLGGHHQLVNIKQVLQTSETDSTPLGSTGAYSVTAFKAHTFTNSFNEFGIILNICCIRKEHTYCQGLDKYWTKRDVFDIYNPTFAHIGEVPVYTNEVYWQPGNTDVLGYNEAWYEYRSQSSKVTGLLNPLAPANLSSFVLTDVFESKPVLDDAFIFEDSQGLDRALVASADVTDQFICDFYFQYTISAVMPVHSTPGLIDHY